MNVASRELCEELFRLGEWDDTLCWWNIFKPYKDGRPHVKADTYRHQSTDKHIPAYDLGFLLRKLPPFTKVWMTDEGKGVAEWSYGPSSMRVTAYNKRKAKVVGHWRTPNKYRADTPEDAAAKLCITLINQGVLPNSKEGGEK